MTPLDVRALLDPEIAAGVAAFGVDLSLLSDELLPSIRAGIASTPPAPPSKLVTVSDHDIPGRPGASVRVHRPMSDSAPRPCLYWIHAGGYVLGNNVMDDQRLQRWCEHLDCVAVSIDYRLAPEHPFPIPLEDCYEGLRWIRDSAERFGIDTDRLGIGGASAGGGLSAALALLTRDRGEIDVAFQLLVYPMMDDRFVTTSSQWDDPVWPVAGNRYGWTSYLRGLDHDDVPYHAAAARAQDLAGLPPAMMVVGALDCLSDEDIDYAVRLRHAGVRTDLMVYAGANHGFYSMAPGSPVGRRARRDIDDWLARVMGVAG